jgi:enoyl-CoA hydratase
MSIDTLRVDVTADGMATVAFNRPDKLNTLSIRLRQDLDSTVQALAADPAVRVLILTGTGRAFTAGLDLDEWAAPAGVAAAAYVHDAVASLQRFRGPVIGAINGLAITGGVEIALACDLLIASTDARFADTHVKVGLLPGWGGSARLIRRVGLMRAKELALTGRFLSADEALAWGLVNRVVPPAQLLPEALALARQIAVHPAEAVMACKQLLDREADVSLAEALRIERAASIAANSGVTHGEIQARLDRLRRQGAPK